MLTPEQFNWHIDLVKGRYHIYNLSSEQAEQIYLYELDKNAYSEKHFFSQWEQWDFEVVTITRILKDEQLSLFLSNHETEVEAYEKYLKEQDNSDYQLKQLAYINEIIDYYKHVFIPGLLMNETVKKRASYLLSDSNKVNYLKEEFKKYLPAAKKEILVNSFRHNRTFRPNELKQMLLWHSLHNIWPDYDQFYAGMDQPTRSIADFLHKKAFFVYEELKDFIIARMAERKRFFDELLKNYFGEITGGWHVVVQGKSQEEELTSIYMSLVLLYG